MKKLTTHDIENLKLKAGYDGPVTLTREDFEALIAAYPANKNDAVLRNTSLPRHEQEDED